jgi:hypothetical protein
VTVQVFTFCLLILASGLLSGCSTVKDQESDSNHFIQTDQISYVSQLESVDSRFIARYSLEIVSRFENTTGQTLYIESWKSPDSSFTPFAGLYHITEGKISELGSAYGGLLWETETRVIAVEPGENRRDTIRISGPYEWDFGTNKHYGELEGTFRLAYSSVATCLKEDTDVIDPECRLQPQSEWPQSNDFEVRLEETDSPDLKKLIQTDRTSYIAEPAGLGRRDIAQYGFEVISRIRNTTDQTLYLRQRRNDRGPIYGIRYLGPESFDHDRFSYVMGPPLNNGFESNPIIALKPGEERIDTLHVLGPGSTTVPTGKDEPVGEMEGLFQIKYLAGLCLQEHEDGTEDVGCLISPGNLPSSNEFEVKLSE